jgi:hypothetical protein
MAFAAYGHDWLCYHPVSPFEHKITQWLFNDYDATFTGKRAIPCAMG